MESEESKISVFVCREEKLVSGLSRRTTCADVVSALLEDQNLQQHHHLSGPSQSYCVVEKWRGFERILPNKTKILRLWDAWGEERESVRFVLVKHAASFAHRGPRSAEARLVLSSRCVWKGRAGAPGGPSSEKQRRVVRKAFRKLEKMNKDKDTSSVEKMETLVHLVISQDHTIRQQVQRIQELDSEIERREAKVHLDRIQRHGVNYVQDTYLADAAATDAAASANKETGKLLLSLETLAKFEEYYARRCEEVVRLQEELSEHEALADDVTAEIQEELNQRWMERMEREELRRKEALSSAPSEADELLLEGERIRTQLDTSLYIGLRLNADLDDARSDLNRCQEIWGANEQEIRDLLEKLNILDVEEETRGEERCNPPVTAKSRVMCTLETRSEWMERDRALSKTGSVHDDDSDTGLSSLHSQDSDTHPVCEAVV